MENAYKTLIIARDAEAVSVKKNQEADDDYDSLLRKIKNFIENEEK